jgi:Ni,Fe-hydrogenase I cytochrome b subunit
MITNKNKFQIMLMKYIKIWWKMIIKKIHEIYFMVRKICMQMIENPIQNYIKSVMGTLIIKIGILEKVQYFLITRRGYKNLIKK